MKLLEIKSLKYDAWQKINDKLFIRVCKNNDFRIFTAKIRIQESSIKCETPMRLPVKSVDSTKSFYITNIEDHDTLIKAVIWIDTYLTKELKAEVEKPFMFNWSNIGE